MTRERLINLIVGLTTMICTLFVVAVLPEGYAPNGVTVPGFSLAATGSRAEARPLCGSEAIREEMRGMAIRGIEMGFQKHVEHLFEVWVRDPAEQPRRAKVGMQNGISAYLRARDDIIKWDLPAC